MLKHYMASFIPSELDLDMTGVSSTLIELQSDTIDSARLYNQEYEGMPNKVLPEHIFFGVNYTVILNYDASCLSVCNEC